LRPSFTEALAVYLQRRVLVVLLLGFSSGLPIVLVGATLQAWMKTSGIDVKTIGLFAAVAIPYNIKFLWAPLVDALDVPFLAKAFGRRRAWLLLSQAWLIAAIALLACCDPVASAFLVAVAAFIVAAASATQDIVVDAFRVESLPENEQAAGMASYVAAYRVGALISGAGALLLVTAFHALSLGDRVAWTSCYLVMAALVLVGVLGTLLAVEPASSATAEAEHALPSRRNSVKRALQSALDSFRDFLSRDLAVAALAFVALFKLADALAFALLTPFVLDIGFSLPQLAAIRNGVGFIVAVLGGFAGGLVARALPLAASLWVGGILQTAMILAFSLQAVAGNSAPMLTFTTTIEFFTDAVGTVIFVAYLSALCNNPLYTATQYALLTALAAIGRNVFALGTGYIAHAVGWAWFFVVCALCGLPALVLLAWLQRKGHFAGLAARKR
jgi:PAT family beta-lactamase induction signal transducer AmpG